MVVPSMEIVQKPQEIVSKHPNDNSGGNQVLFIDTKSRFDNHFDLMRERDTPFLKYPTQYYVAFLTIMHLILQINATV